MTDVIMYYDKRNERRKKLSLRRVALVRNDVSEEGIAFIIRVTKIGALGKTLAVSRFSSPAS
jgi:hypothetical protein